MRKFEQRWNRGNFLGVLLLATAMVLGGLLAARGQGLSTSPSVKHQLTGLAGIAAGQSARLNVTNLSERPVTVILEFIDMNLHLLASERCGRPDQQGPSVCRLTPGQTVRLEFNADQLALGPGVRRYLRAQVAVNGGAKDVITTFEMFDNATGRTAMHVGEACLIDMN